MFKQETAFSCTASVLQMLHLYYKGREISHTEAIAKLKCEPDGAELIEIGKVMEMPSKELKSFVSVARALRKGHPVIADDNKTYQDSHAILIVGATPQGFYFLDPAKGKQLWRSFSWFARAATEFHVLV